LSREPGALAKNVDGSRKGNRFTLQGKRGGEMSDAALLGREMKGWRKYIPNLSKLLP
jgi:hypothetical protein